MSATETEVGKRAAELIQSGMSTEEAIAQAMKEIPGGEQVDPEEIKRQLAIFGTIMADQATGEAIDKARREGTLGPVSKEDLGLNY